MGRALGPADVLACPILPEAKTAVAELEHAFSARIEGQPGVGKSVCALQAAKILADQGWTVLELTDPRAARVDLPASSAERTLYFIDDAHLTAEGVLRITQAGPTRMLLSTHNAMAQGSGGRGAIIMDPKRAVGVIASGLRSNRAATLAVVNRADDRVTASNWALSRISPNSAAGPTGAAVAPRSLRLTSTTSAQGLRRRSGLIHSGRRKP